MAGTCPCSWLSSHSPMLQPSLHFHAFEHCVWGAPCLQGLLLPASSALSPAALTHVPPSVTSVPIPLLGAGSGAHGTLCASDLLLWFFSPSAHRVLRTGMGLGQCFACSKCSMCARGHKIKCSNWWREHSRKQLPWFMPFPGRGS